jgi:hypothetical protein
VHDQHEKGRSALEMGRTTQAPRSRSRVRQLRVADACGRHPAGIVTAQRILAASPTVVHIVPLTSTLRSFHSEVSIAPDAHNGLEVVSAAHSRH